MRRRAIIITALLATAVLTMGVSNGVLAHGKLTNVTCTFELFAQGLRIRALSTSGWSPARGHSARARTTTPIP
jgi:hypothetical protein